MTDEAAQRAAVIAEARTWIGTPFHDVACVKGAGVDCAHFVHAAYTGAGIFEDLGIERYDPQWFLHRDEDLWPFPNTSEIMANAMWALDDFTVENGATRLIPGSHLWPRDREPQPGEAVAAVAPAGSAILWLGGVLHGG